MPRTETVLRIFVASPGDVADERQKLEEVVLEVNQIVGSIYSIRLELVRWETSTSPAMGIEPQDVINRQIDDDYDIFVGIMWSRFGTATNGYDSGTEEEFYRAKERHDIDSSVDIMFYFKDEPIAPSRVDPDQLKKINNFKEKTGGLGLYYWIFKDIDDFERTFRRHISDRITKFAKSSVQKSPNNIHKFAEKIKNVEEDVGLLDLLANLEAESPKFLTLMERLSEKTDWINERVNAHTASVGKLNSETFGAAPREFLTKIINSSADDMEEYASYIDSIKSLFSEYTNKFFKMVVEVGSIYKESFDRESDEIREFFTNVKNIDDNVNAAKIAMEEFRTAISSLPRMTSKITKAKRHLLASMNDIISEMNQINSLLHDTLN
ncbi:DUF4062 domain-containing protein [Pararhizobium qamdonense]|uniref:DUF4062 domain-containing protein n=1 Tax=Pararhizobium qamdonense TaxID=3031126 RepID=UPI0023E19F85|nr:DUF4062 domain-containing protein [Pararhizobium qamdonense]